MGSYSKARKLSLAAISPRFFHAVLSCGFGLAAGCGSGGGSDEPNGTDDDTDGGTDDTDGSTDDTVDTDGSTDEQSIAEILAEDPRFSLFVQNLELAQQLELLDDDAAFTVFAPTDAAVNGFLSEAGLSLAQFGELSMLPEIMTYHMLPGEHPAEGLEGFGETTTVEGTDVVIHAGADGIVLNDGVRIVDEPILARNGIVHVVDAVLLRPAPSESYTSQPNLAIADADPEVGPSRTSDSIVINDPIFLRDLMVSLNIQHTFVFDLRVSLEHEQSGTVLRLVEQPFSANDNMAFVLSDAADLDVQDDVLNGAQGDPAYVASHYRPFEPLMFGYGTQLQGAWTLHIDDLRPSEAGKLVDWAMTVTYDHVRPAPALAIARPRDFSGLLPAGLSEGTRLKLKRLSGLQGEVELSSASVDGVSTETVVVADGSNTVAMEFLTARNAALGPRSLEIIASADAGAVEQRLDLDAQVVAPDTQSVELLAHVPLTTLTTEPAEGNDIWGWTDPDTGREYALMGHSYGTAFVDVSTPEAPVLLGELSTHTTASLWRDIKVYQDHAFIVSEAELHGMQVFDLTELRGVTSPQSFAETAHYAGFGNAHNIAINEDTGYAYVVGATDDRFPSTCFGGLLMMNIATPTSPVFAGCFAGGAPAGHQPGPAFPTDAYTHDVQCVSYAGPDLDYVGRELCVSSDGQILNENDYLALTDVTDKANPIQIARITYQGAGYAHQGWLTEDHEFFILNDEHDEFDGINTRSYIFDVRDLDAPVLFGVFDNPRDAIGHNTYIKGHLAYQSNYTSGLRIVDISNIATMDLAEVAYFDTHPEDDANDDGSAGLVTRSSGCQSQSQSQSQSRSPSGGLASPGGFVHHPQDGFGCGIASFQGAWSNYPFFESGIVILSDTQRGLFILGPGPAL